MTATARNLGLLCIFTLLGCVSPQVQMYQAKVAKDELDFVNRECEYASQNGQMGDMNIYKDLHQIQESGGAGYEEMFVDPGYYSPGKTYQIPKIFSTLKDYKGRTLLLCLVESSCFNSAKLLLDDGIDPNVTDSNGKKPLDYAIENENPNLIKILGGQAPIQKLESPSEIYGRYCSNKRQIRSMQVTVLATMNPSANGVALDEADKQIVELKNYSRNFAKDLFFLEGDENTKINPGYLFLREPVRNALLDFGFEKIKYQINGQVLSLAAHNSRAISDLDIQALRHAYTFNMPKTAQDMLFPKYKFHDDDETGCNGGPDEDGRFSPIRSGYLGLGRDCGFSPGQAIADKDQFWKLYAIRFTKIQEAPGNDPYTLKFTVDLDLNPFCQYGVALTDLTSK